MGRVDTSAGYGEILESGVEENDGVIAEGIQ